MLCVHEVDMLSLGRRLGFGQGLADASSNTSSSLRCPSGQLWLALCVRFVEVQVSSTCATHPGRLPGRHVSFALPWAGLTLTSRPCNSDGYCDFPLPTHASLGTSSFCHGCTFSHCFFWLQCIFLVVSAAPISAVSIEPCSPAKRST